MCALQETVRSDRNEVRTMTRRLLITSLIAISLSGAAHAAVLSFDSETPWLGLVDDVTLIDFDDLVAPATIYDQYPGLTFGSTLANFPKALDSTTGLTGFTHISAPNYLAVRDNLAGGGDWRVDSATPVNGVGFWIFDLQTATRPATIVNVTLQDASVEQVSVADLHPDAVGQDWRFVGVISTASPITGIEIIIDPTDHMIFDNLQFMSCAVENVTTGLTYCTIQACIDDASNGDVCVAQPGTYNELIDFGGKAVTLRSADGPDATIIDGTGLTGSVVRIVNGQGADTVLEGFTITGGTTTGDGGGMYIDGSSPTIKKCYFVSNVADDASPTLSTFGGGLYCTAGNPRISECVFGENVAADGAGVSLQNSSAAIFVGCFFTANTATGSIHSHGAGMRCDASDPLIFNCVFNGNHAVRSSDTATGGALACSDSSPQIVNCSFYANIADTDGGGIATFYASNPTVANCVFWSNSVGGVYDESAQIYNYLGGATSVSFSTIQNCSSYCADPNNGNIADDPLFLFPTGSDGVAGTPDDDLHLTGLSPCVDAGDTSALPAGLFVDLDGGGRVLDFAGAPNTGVPALLTPDTVDMGAYEYRQFRLLGDLNGDGFVNFGDIDPFIAILTGG